MACSSAFSDGNVQEREDSISILWSSEELGQFTHFADADLTEEANSFCVRAENSTYCVQSLVDAVQSLRAVTGIKGGEPVTEAPAADPEETASASATLDESEENLENMAATESTVEVTTDEEVLQETVKDEEQPLSDKDVAFDVVVDTSGGRARFVYRDGQDANAVIEAFCALHLPDAPQNEQCVDNLLIALEAQLTLPALLGKPLTLQVQIGENGETANFVHEAGGDPNAEALAFCTTHVPQLDSKTCITHLVTALTKQLQEAEATATSTTSSASSSSTAHTKLAQLLGPEILLRDGDAFKTVDTADALRGKVVGLYFAADWCPPCRQFTPVLAKYYNRVKHFRHQNFELVWLSASKAQPNFNAYLAEMPWAAVPYQDRGTFEKLRGIYGVQSFPTLILVDAEGRVLQKDFRDQVMRDPSGDGFPYRTAVDVIKSVLKVLYTTLVPSSLRAKIQTAIPGRRLAQA
eukprot:CAMPEP_0185770234 /NCGR_PEP_ID=MMETSP1174-20130828/58064_1 /TAXON_ID=35687 /ORGANISM="Dictyocha speculum, Strain CCMP1381" /LENGTH=465 /DNA_ID=CAMNT_0028455583 /DNA_START=14 /DNA_END=1411 /DNA_ORIENTATION=+